ncbi:hypothetical protein LSH36_891g01008 [Paralvinella palmiformis]|uniref:Uncharacterized protein n=1 Tax=Paralvinella palmiformis TaxID=53620 RepID=A0AAD9IYK3_9ANNE|nr:hypothetical protein LSH36_891g01008 [Paralvinella palmiformis]
MLLVGIWLETESVENKMDSMIQIIRGVLLAVFLYLGETVDAEDDSLIQPYLVTYGNLTCHRCVKSIHGYNCIVLRDMSRIEREHCRSDQHYCMVEKYITNGVLQTFTRGCAEECVPGCDSAGVNYVIEKCYSCCQKHFCNIGNGGSDLHTRANVASSVIPALISGVVLARCDIRRYIW